MYVRVVRKYHIYLSSISEIERHESSVARRLIRASAVKLVRIMAWDVWGKLLHDFNTSFQGAPEDIWNESVQENRHRAKRQKGLERRSKKGDHRSLYELDDLEENTPL